MPAKSSGQTCVRRLNEVLRGELTAVNQYFSHILVLCALGDAETAAAIEPVNNADFPNAMRMIDHLIAQGEQPELCSPTESYEQHLPVVSAHRPQMFAADLELETRLLAIFEAAQAALASSEDAVARRLVEDALSRRKPHIQWLQQQLRAAGQERAPETALFGPAAAALSFLYAQMIVQLEQSLAHAFVLRHSRETALADATWTLSYDTMLHGKAIVDLFGGRGAAPDLSGVAASAALDRPRVGREVAEIIALELSSTGRCRQAAEAAGARIDDDEAARVCRELAAYYGALRECLATEIFPSNNFPGTLRSFDKVCATYIVDEHVSD